MAHEHIDVILENQNLKSEFARRNLDLTQVWQPAPNDLELENRQLHHLLDWVEKYQECGNRQAMEAEGYDFPPIYPDIDPDSDWFRFRLWLLGKPIRKTAKSRLPSDLVLKHPNDLTDDEIVVILEKLTAGLGEIHLSGKMVFPENVKRYVSPSPGSLTILRRAQEEEDKRMKKIMDEMECEKNDKTERINKAAREEETDVDDGLPF